MAPEDSLCLCRKAIPASESSLASLLKRQALGLAECLTDPFIVLLVEVCGLVLCHYILYNLVQCRWIDCLTIRQFILCLPYYIVCVYLHTGPCVANMDIGKR